MAHPGLPDLLPLDLGPQPIALTIAVAPERVAACLGPAERVSAHASLAAAVAEAAAAATALIRPLAVCAAVPGSDATGLRPEGGPSADEWRAADWVVPFAATIGGALEGQALASVRAGRLVRGMALDAAGSAASLELADALVHRLATGPLGERGLMPTLLAFPGDEGFPIAAQKSILAALPPDALERTGLSIQPTGALTPLKSVAGVIGLGSGGSGDAAAPPVRRPCESCPVRDRCSFRRP